MHASTDFCFDFGIFLFFRLHVGVINFIDRSGGNRLMLLVFGSVGHVTILCRNYV